MGGACVDHVPIKNCASRDVSILRMLKQEATLRGHSGVVRACQFSPDSRLIATCSWDKTIRVFLTHDHLVS